MEREELYRALLARDRRFDGRFFVGVRTTGIYCRPICRVRTPLLKNVTFYDTAVAAEDAGFRPCMRCRPESAPGTPAWRGSSATVSRAMRLLDSGVDAARIPAKVGLSERRLRQLFVEHLGVSPQSISRLKRLDLARQLIDTTAMPMTDVAFVSGFKSVRRFNDAVRERFRRSPTELRRKPKTREDDGIVVKLSYRPPLNWAAMLEFLAGRGMPGVELVENDRYYRTIKLGKVEGWLEVENDISESQLVVRFHLPLTPRLVEAVARVRALFDLDADPYQINSHLSLDKKLRPALEKFPGLRVPGGWDGYELAVRAILGQQVSVKGATTLAGRIVSALGEKLKSPPRPGLTHHFPSPEVMAKANLGELGIFSNRARALNELSRRVAEGELILDGGTEQAALVEIPGIGPWTAQYLAMRAMRDPDAFPESDLVLKRAMVTHRRHDAWAPWRAYAAMYLWKWETVK